MFSGTGWNWCINFNECSQGDFFPGLFLKGKLIRQGKAELVKATLYCNVLMVVHTSPRLRKLCLDLETLTKNPYWRQLWLLHLSHLFLAFSDAAFLHLVQLEWLLRKHLSIRDPTSVAGLQLLLLRKLEKHRSFICLLKPSASTSGREAVTAGPRQSCSGHLESVLWRKTKTKEPGKIIKGIWKINKS